jgi:hypothetical protein
MVMLAMPAAPVFEPCVPLRFCDGDLLVQEPDDRAVWECSLFGWRPVPDDGSGIWSDAEVRDNLVRSQSPGAVGGVRFMPRYLSPGGQLPGASLRTRAEVEAAQLPAVSAVPYVAASGRAPRFVSLRDLAAEYGEELPAAMPVGDVREALAVVLEEQERAEVSYSRVSGRLYARYRARGEGGLEIRTHVYVLNGRR